MSPGLQTQVKVVQKPSAKKAQEKRIQPEPSRLFAGECSACAGKKGVLQRASHGPAPNTVPPIVHEVLRSPEAPDAATSAFAEQRFAYDFCRIPAHFKSSAKIQAKLAVNTPGDVFEQEADRIADQVLAAPTQSAVRGLPPRIQRFAGQATRHVYASPDSVDRVLASSGSPLEPALQQDMEQRFGHDFSHVRVHSGQAAEQSTREVNAHAFTVGNDIVFGKDRFAPGTHEGRRLLAHELTHVVQQSDTDGSIIDQRKEIGGMSLVRPMNQAVQKASGRVRGEHLQRWSWAEIKEKAYDSMIAGIHKARDGMRNGLKRLAAAHLPASLFPIADGIIEVAVTVVEVIVAIIMAVIGIVVGFGEGIIGMIEGLFKLAYGVITLLYDLIAGIITNFDAAKQDLKAFWDALKNLPSALKKLVTDWLGKFSKASSERQSLMIGELTGQVLALIATYAASAGRAGSAAEAGAAAGDTAAVTGEGAATVARARPVLTVIEGGGGRGGSTAARAAASPGAGDIVGNTVLKAEPAVKPIPPLPSPVRLVPPLPKASPAVAKAAAIAPSGTKAVVTGTGVVAATAANLAPKPSPTKPLCSGPTGLSRADPIPIIWYKVREDDYYPKRLSIQGQVYGRDDPSNPRKLPHGEPLGVPNKYWPRLGKVMQLVPSTRGSKAADFRAVLSGYGFDWTGLQADHVQDLEWSGPDSFKNLWPLSDSANLSAGPRQNSNQLITYCETPNGPRIVDQPLIVFKTGPGHYGRFFSIARVER
jgi:hypothetical protein